MHKGSVVSYTPHHLGKLKKISESSGEDSEEEKISGHQEKLA